MSANTTNETPAYDQGYNAGWDGKIWNENPYLNADGEPMTEEAKAWERGRHDGSHDKREQS